MGRVRSLFQAVLKVFLYDAGQEDVDSVAATLVRTCSLLKTLQRYWLEVHPHEVQKKAWRGDFSRLLVWPELASTAALVKTKAHVAREAIEPSQVWRRRASRYMIGPQITSGAAILETQSHATPSESVAHSTAKPAWQHEVGHHMINPVRHLATAVWPSLSHPSVSSGFSDSFVQSFLDVGDAAAAGPRCSTTFIWGWGSDEQDQGSSAETDMQLPRDDVMSPYEQNGESSSTSSWGSWGGGWMSSVASSMNTLYDAVADAAQAAADAVVNAAVAVVNVAVNAAVWVKDTVASAVGWGQEEEEENKLEMELHQIRSADEIHIKARKKKHDFDPKKLVDQRIHMKPLKWVWHPDSDGPKPEDEVKPEESGGKKVAKKKGGEKDKDDSLADFDHQTREDAQALLEKHKMGPEDLQHGQETWRCVPMDEIDQKGQEVTAQGGGAVFGMKAMPSGKIGIEVPARPPIYNPVVGPPTWPSGGHCPKGVKGCYRQILRDPNGLWYWVLTGKGKVAKSEEKLVEISEMPALYAEKTGSNMICHEADKNEFDEPRREYEHKPVTWNEYVGLTGKDAKLKGLPEPGMEEGGKVPEGYPDHIPLYLTPKEQVEHWSHMRPVELPQQENRLFADGVHQMEQYQVEPKAVPDLPYTLTGFLFSGMPNRLSSFLSVGHLQLAPHCLSADSS